MRSMRSGFQKVCHDPARMSGHNCLPGPQTVCSPEGDRMNKTRRFHSAGYCMRWLFSVIEGYDITTDVQQYLNAWLTQN